jgi:hypothetical protein
MWKRCVAVLVKLGRGVDPVGEHRARGAVGLDLGAEDECRFGARDVACVGRHGTSPARVHDQVGRDEHHVRNPAAMASTRRIARSVAGGTGELRALKRWVRIA